ncbi:MAG: hypothetical protein IKY15_03290 [Clostridia bacterium]|nr:hypothetical protein [Clostridia bacterium]
MEDKLQEVERHLMGFVLRKKEELLLVTDNDLKKEIQTQLNCADLFSYMIGLVK